MLENFIFMLLIFAVLFLAVGFLIFIDFISYKLTKISPLLAIEKFLFDKFGGD